MAISDGYSPSFLPVDVPLPHPVDSRETIDLDYPHFTVVFQPSRRLAAGTAVNIDGGALVDLARGDDWHFDPRIPEGDQAGPEIYATNDLDRGHLVRRRDPVWGDAEVASAANLATFSFTNAAPQAAPFNQGPELWVGLEDHVLEYARAWEQRISVFTGPVFAEDDPEYRGIRIPRRFWKIVVWTSGGSEADIGVRVLRAAGFVLDQSAQLDVVLARDSLAIEPPPLAQFLTYQVPIRDVAFLTLLDFTPIIDADTIPTANSIQDPRRSRDGWTALSSAGDIAL